jgi:hypothetical protein
LEVTIAHGWSCRRFQVTLDVGHGDDLIVEAAVLGNGGGPAHGTGGKLALPEPRVRPD